MTTSRPRPSGSGTILTARLTVIAALFATPALADPPPAGFHFYCLKNDCSQSGAASVPHFTRLVADLRTVTASVSRSIRYRNARSEQWRANVSVGNCDDFALTKRARLIGIGYPASALRMAVGHTGAGEYHAFLVVVIFAASWLSTTSQTKSFRSARQSFGSARWLLRTR